MLRDDLYEIKEIRTINEFEFFYEIHLNKDTDIYRGHFPSRPITPGACLLEIARELLEIHEKQPLDIRQIKSMKFLNIIEPSVHPDIVFHFIIKERLEDQRKVMVEIGAGSEVFTKMSMFFAENVPCNES